MIIILGKNGQLSKSFQEQLRQKKIRFKCFSSKEINLLHTKTLKKLLKKNFNILINTSAFTAVDLAERKRNSAMKINAHSLGYLSKICNAKNALLIHFSTDYIFNKRRKKPIKENEKSNPINFYGYSKNQGEKKIFENSKKYIIFRVSWLCSKFSNNFLSKITDKILNNEDLKIVNDQIGCPTFCDDVVNAIIKLFLNKKIFKTKSSIYNLSNSGSCNWHSYSKFIFSEIKKIKNTKKFKNTINKIKTTDLKLPAKRPKYSLLDNNSFQKEFGIRMPHWKISCKKNLKMYLRDK